MPGPPKLTSDQRSQFEGQLAKAKKIMDAQVGEDGVVKTGPAWTHARKARDRALRMLGRKNPDASPGEKNAKRKGRDPTGPEAVGGLAGAMAKKLSPRETTRKLKKIGQTPAEDHSGGRPKGISRKTYDKYYGGK